MLVDERQSTQMSKNYKWCLNPVWYRMLYSCTHMITVGIKGLIFSKTFSLYVHHSMMFNPAYMEKVSWFDLLIQWNACVFLLLNFKISPESLFSCLSSLQLEISTLIRCLKLQKSSLHLLCAHVEVDRKWKFNFRPKPKVDRKWRNTFGRNRMCHRKWSGTFGRKPKPKVNRVWADTAMEASKSRTASVSQQSRASDIFHPYPRYVSRVVCH